MSLLNEIEDMVKKFGYQKVKWMDHISKKKLLHENLRNILG